MAQETVGYNIFARFQFFGKAGTAQMKQTSMAFASLRRNAMLAKSGVTQVGSGVRSLSMVGLGAAYAIGKVVKTAADFRQQMSVVRSVTDLTQSQFKSLNDQALKLGATTTFTAKEVGQGMEAFGRAGWNAVEISNAIRPALKMAEADSMKLADSTRILADGLRMFGLDASKAGYAADVLAYVSKNTNTNIMALGEGLAYAGPAAARAKMNFHETMGTLGLLANIGIKASRSGTVLKNAWIKLTQMSKPAIKLFGGRAGLLKVLTDNEGKMRKFHVIMAQTILRLRGIKNEALRNNLAFKMFGIRGAGSLDAFMRAKPGQIKKMLVDIEKASKGTAEEMARIQQANLAGDWKRFTSAVSGAAIAMGTVLIPTIRRVFEGTGGLTSVFQTFADAIKMMNEGATESAVLKKYGKTVAGIIFGIKEGFESAKQTLKAMGKAFMEIFGQFIGKGKNTVKVIAKVITKFVVMAAVLAPVAAAIGGVIFVAKGMFNVLIGGIKIVTALASPWGIAILAIVRLFAGARRKGESFFAMMARGLKNVTAFAYKLTAPFRWLIKKLGVIPGLITAIVAAKGFKLLIGALGGGIIRGVVGGAAGAAGGGLLARLFGGGLGAAAAGAGGAAAPAAAGAAAAKGAGVKAAVGAVVKSVGVKAAATGMAGLSASIGVWFLGLKKLADAHSEKSQAELRKRLGSQYQDMVDQHLGLGGILDSSMRQFAEKARKAALARPIKPAGPKPAPGTPEAAMGRTMQVLLAGRAGRERMTYFEQRVAPFLKDVAATARVGMTGRAKERLTKAGISGETLRRFMADLSAQGKEYYKFTPAMIKALNEVAGEMKKEKRRPIQVNLNVDGKRLATVTATQRQESRERAGKVPPPGARRRALRTGTE